MSGARRRRRSRRWSPDEARQVLAELSRSGQPAARFAAEHGLGVERLYRWQRRLRASAERAPGSPRFAEVTVRSIPAPAIELVLPGGAALRLAGPSRVEDAVSILSRLQAR